MGVDVLELAKVFVYTESDPLDIRSRRGGGVKHRLWAHGWMQKECTLSSGCRGRDGRERARDDLLREGEHEVVATGLHERVGLRVGQTGGALAIDRGDDFALANRLDGGLAAGIHLQPNGSI